MRNVQEAQDLNQFLVDPQPVKPFLVRAFRKAWREFRHLAGMGRRLFFRPTPLPDEEFPRAEMVQMIQDCNLVLNEVVRDLGRLQSQVEVLQQLLKESAGGPPFSRDAGQKRAG